MWRRRVPDDGWTLTEIEMKSHRVSDPATQLWTPLAIFLLSACLLIGCSKNAGNGDVAVAGSSPAHPAMRAAPSVSGSTGGLGTLPQGHPPVEGRSPAPAHPPMQGGSPPAPSGGSVSAEEVTAQLARFGMAVKIPEGWKLERGSSMRLATVRLLRGLRCRPPASCCPCGWWPSWSPAPSSPPSSS